MFKRGTQTETVKLGGQRQDCGGDAAVFHICNKIVQNVPLMSWFCSIPTADVLICRIWILFNPEVFWWIGCKYKYKYWFQLQRIDNKLVVVVYGYLCADASLQLLDESGHVLLFNPAATLHLLQRESKVNEGNSIFICYPSSLSTPLKWNATKTCSSTFSYISGLFTTCNLKEQFDTIRFPVESWRFRLTPLSCLCGK